MERQSSCSRSRNCEKIKLCLYWANKSVKKKGKPSHTWGQVEPIVCCRRNNNMDKVLERVEQTLTSWHWSKLPYWNNACTLICEWCRSWAFRSPSRYRKKCLVPVSSAFNLHWVEHNRFPIEGAGNYWWIENGCFSLRGRQKWILPLHSKTRKLDIILMKILNKTISSFQFLLLLRTGGPILKNCKLYKINLFLVTKNLDS